MSSKLLDPDDHGIDLQLLVPEPAKASLCDDGVANGRLDLLVQLVDHCASAKEIAETLGDDFLAYMLSMSIHQARTEMRPKTLRAAPRACPGNVE